MWTVKIGYPDSLRNTSRLPLLTNDTEPSPSANAVIHGNHTASSLLLQASSMADENRSLCLQMKVRPLVMFVCCTQDDLLEVYSQGRYSSGRTMPIHNNAEK